ncbi:hypothetical protein JCM8097_004983 [Rhodosporidiobolus ruineniae]
MSASPAPSSAPSPQTQPQASTSSTSKASYSDQEEDTLVGLVSELGTGKWGEVKDKLVEQGFKSRTVRGIEQHYQTLKSRAEAIGVPLQGHVPLAPFTLQEDSRMLALLDLVHEDAQVKNRKTTTRAPSVSWVKYNSLFPGRGHHDLFTRAGNFKQLLKGGSKKKEYVRQLEAEKKVAREYILEEFPDLAPSPALPSSSSSASSALVVETNTPNPHSGPASSSTPAFSSSSSASSTPAPPSPQHFRPPFFSVAPVPALHMPTYGLMPLQPFSSFASMPFLPGFVPPSPYAPDAPGPQTAYKQVGAPTAEFPAQSELDSLSPSSPSSPALKSSPEATVSSPSTSHDLVPPDSQAAKKAPQASKVDFAAQTDPFLPSSSTSSATQPASSAQPFPSSTSASASTQSHLALPSSKSKKRAAPVEDVWTRGIRLCRRVKRALLEEEEGGAEVEKET